MVVTATDIEEAAKQLWLRFIPSKLPTLYKSDIARVFIYFFLFSVFDILTTCIYAKESCQSIERLVI